MLPALGPTVAAAPFLVRAFAYTTSWVVHSMIVQTVLHWILLWYERNGWVTKTTRDPQLPFWRMIYHDIVGFYAWLVGAGVVQAWFNPSFDSWSYDFPFARLFWYQLPVFLAYDTYFFWMHRFAHVNKWMFRNIHAMHHRPDAHLDVTSNSFEHPVDGFLVVGIPLGCVVWLGCHLNNFWAMVVPIHTIATLFVLGHSGYDLYVDKIADVALLAVSPFILVQMTSANCIHPMDHVDHHTNPRSNYGLFFTFWDDLMGSTHVKRAGTTLRLWLIGYCVYVPWVWYYEWVFLQPASFGFVLLLHVLTPLPQLVYRLLGGALSRLVTRLPIWDAVRRDLQVTYASPGERGSFRADPSRRYIFCYQPMGVQARGAWYTFMGKGTDSPVTGLADVKMAIGRVLWATPVVQQVLALFGGCPSSYRALRELLTDESPKSVCITIGGWREAKYLETYSVVARCRRGFARLALETGAALVPVIGVGEPLLAGRPTFGGRIFKSLQPYRPYPLKVVFGEALEPRAGETLEALHERYCNALLYLAKQHGVPMTIAE